MVVPGIQWVRGKSGRSSEALIPELELIFIVGGEYGFAVVRGMAQPRGGTWSHLPPVHLRGRRDGTGSRSPGPGLSVYRWCALGATGAHLRTEGFIPHVSPVSPAWPPGCLHGSCECWPMCPTWNGLLGLHPHRAAGWGRGRGRLAKGSCHSCWGISSPAHC